MCKATYAGGGEEEWEGEFEEVGASDEIEGVLTINEDPDLSQEDRASMDKIKN